MTRLPPKLKRQRSGIERAPQKEWPRHRRHVRSYGCCVRGCSNRPIDFAHGTSRGAGGGDETGIGLCREHHSEQHSSGIITFQQRHNLDWDGLAAEFVRTSPDVEMRKSLRLVAAEEIAND